MPLTLPIDSRLNGHRHGLSGNMGYGFMEERWLSVDEIAAHLGVSRDTVYRWIEQHDMPAHKVGRLWKFKVSEVDAWVKSGGATLRTSKIDGARQ